MSPASFLRRRVSESYKAVLREYEVYRMHAMGGGAVPERHACGLRSGGTGR